MIASFVITLFVLCFILVSHAEEYNPPVKGISDLAAKPVVILDQGVRMSAYSSSETMEAILDELGISFWPEDKIKAFPDPELGLGTTITIERATPVIVLDGGRKLAIRTFCKTVGELLKEKKIKLNRGDKINFKSNYQLKNNLRIIIIRVASRIVKIEKDIPYDSITQEDASMFIGKSYTKQEGKTGKKIITYKVRYENGIEVSREKLSEKILSEPVDEINVIGTKPTITVYCGGYDSSVSAAADHYGVSADHLCACMRMESQFDYRSVGYGYGGPFYGLFQYQMGTWYYLSSLAGFGGSNWDDATAQIYTTAYSWSQGGCWRWRRCACP